MSNEKEKTVSLSVDDGRERITINNKYGDELGVFYFRPTDTQIIDRYNDAISRLDAALEPLMALADAPQAASNDAEEAAQALSAAMKEARTRICEIFDFIFDANVSEAFFDRVDPFVLSNGHFYCENVVEAIGKFIAERIGGEVKHLNARVTRYTHGYRTGKHKDGKK